MADSERLAESLRGEIFDLRMELQAQAADLVKKRDAEAERDEYAEALLRTEEELQNQGPRLQRAEMRVAILEAELETVRIQVEEAERRSLQLELSRQAEGFRVTRHLLLYRSRQRLFDGFYRWRASVLDRVCWRLGLARRSAATVVMKSNGVVDRDTALPPRRKVPPAEPLHADEQTQIVLTSHEDRSLTAQYNTLMREAKVHSKTIAQRVAIDSGIDSSLAQRWISANLNKISDSNKSVEVDSVSSHGSTSSTATKTAPVRRRPEEEGFGRDIASIQKSIHNVLTAGTSPKRPMEPHAGPLAATDALRDSKAAIQRLLRTQNKT